jgi:hypothetical protein
MFAASKHQQEKLKSRAVKQAATLNQQGNRSKQASHKLA